MNILLERNIKLENRKITDIKRILCFLYKHADTLKISPIQIKYKERLIYGGFILLDDVLSKLKISTKFKSGWRIIVGHANSSTHPVYGFIAPSIKCITFITSTVIRLPTYSYTFKELQKNINEYFKKINESEFVHEFTHIIDTQRFSKSFNLKSPKDNKEYFNSPAEFNAYFMDGISTLTKYVKHNKELMALPFNKWYGRVVPMCFYVTFIINLNEKYSKKFKIRLYEYYTHYKHKYQNLQDDDVS